MSGRPWEWWQKSAPQARSDLPMQIAAGGPMAAEAPRIAPGQSPSRSDPSTHYGSQQYDQQPPWARRFGDAPPGPAQYDPNYHTGRTSQEQGYATAPAFDAVRESWLPGIENGPADAFRHLVWAAELTRRYGPWIAGLILGQHETRGRSDVGWSQQAEDMDRHNNAIGMRIGQDARDYQDVLDQVTSTVMATSPDGAGTWKDPRHHVSSPAPAWLPRENWKGRTKVQKNWYDNPDHAGSLVFPQIWPHTKQYRYGGEDQRAANTSLLNELYGLAGYAEQRWVPKWIEQHFSK